MSTGSNNLRIGTDRAMAGLLAELNERVRQLERSMPGSGGGGSVRGPFSIDDVAFGSGAEFDPREVLEAVELTEWGGVLRDRVVHYYPTTTERDLDLTDARRKVGMVVMVGTVAGTGTALPRYYEWDGSAWLPIGWWGSTGRLGVQVTGAAHSISSGSGNQFTFNAEAWDPDGWIAVPSNALTCPTGWSGLYTISASVSWASSSLGTTPAIAVLVAGSTVGVCPGVSVYGYHTVTFDYPIAAGNTVALYAFQNSGGNVNATPRLTITRRGV